MTFGVRASWRSVCPAAAPGGEYFASDTLVEFADVTLTNNMCSGNGW